MASKIVIRSKYEQNNDVTIRVQDCCRFLSSIPDSSANLIITSPPYNIGKSYEPKHMPIHDYLTWQKEVISSVLQKLAPGGSVCWQVGVHISATGEVIPLDLLFHPIFSELATEHDLQLRNRIIWHFEHGLNCKHRFSGRYETILWYTKGADYQFNLDDVRVPQKYPGKRAYKGSKKGEFSGNPLGKNPGDVWTFPNVKANHPEKTIHPCQFPIELAERLILALSNPGDLVLDPFAGVGSTLVAAYLHNRRAAGCDVNSIYIKIAKQRLNTAAIGNLRAYRPHSRKIYQPNQNSELTNNPWKTDISTRTA